jgi:hypothetical protein
MSKDRVLMWLCWDGGYVKCYREGTLLPAVRRISSDSDHETGTGSGFGSGEPCRSSLFANQ